MQIVSYEVSTEPWSALLTVLHIAEPCTAANSTINGLLPLCKGKGGNMRR
jgi:hypothetical protein